LHHDEAEQQAEGRDRFEVHQRLQPDPAHGAHVADLRNPRHDDQKISGVMVTLISEMKISPSGFMSAAKAGNSAPSSAPSAAPMATNT
jgi:hypothetical protein